VSKVADPVRNHGDSYLAGGRPFANGKLAAEGVGLAVCSGTVMQSTSPMPSTSTAMGGSAERAMD